MRWNGIIIGLFSLVALGVLAAALFILLASDDKSEAHWGALMAVIGFVGGFLAGTWNTAHMRFDESPPQMPVEQALEFAKLAREQGIEDALMHVASNQANSA